jgi:hypothetical protein
VCEFDTLVHYTEVVKQGASCLCWKVTSTFVWLRSDRSLGQ